MGSGASDGNLLTLLSYRDTLNGAAVEGGGVNRLHPLLAPVTVTPSLRN